MHSNFGVKLLLDSLPGIGDPLEAGTRSREGHYAIATAGRFRLSITRREGVPECNNIDACSFLPNPKSYGERGS
tara:strand:- start:1436 stop:1657 length:222 start_codon:yes stop_codon:yes gene_type:complete